jgi:hypothetical protein
MAPRGAENCRRYNVGSPQRGVFAGLITNKIHGDMQHYMIEYLIGKMLKTATVTWFEEYPTICLKTLRKCKKNSSR